MRLEGVRHLIANVKKNSSISFGDISLWYSIYWTNIVCDPVRRTGAKGFGAFRWSPAASLSPSGKARPGQPLWCRTCKLTKLQAITYVVILTITLLSAATIAFKELFFRELPILLAPPGWRWGKFCPKFRLNGEVHHFKMHFLSLQKYRPPIFYNISSEE